MTSLRTVSAGGLEVFYREAGEPGAPKLLLLGGFPSSSHQFRNLMPALADRFHLVSIDYPGFGNTEMPDPAEWDYTFDHLAEIVDEALLAIDFTGPMGLYMQAHGGPIGNRLISLHPDWLQWQVIQNANTYEEGFTAVWDGIRHALWANRNARTEAPLEAFLEPETLKAIYLTGHPIRRRSARTTGTWICTSWPGRTRAVHSWISSTTTGRTPPSTPPGRDDCAVTSPRR